jgi:hypothetical protein
LNTRTINRGPDRENAQRQRELMRENMSNNNSGTGDQNIDDKISKLQNLLAMAKGGK